MQDERFDAAEDDGPPMDGPVQDPSADAAWYVDAVARNLADLGPEELSQVARAARDGSSLDGLAWHVHEARRMVAGVPGGDALLARLHASLAEA